MYIVVGVVVGRCWEMLALGGQGRVMQLMIILSSHGTAGVLSRVRVVEVMWRWYW